MIDIKDLIENPQKYVESQRARQADESAVDALIAAQKTRAAAISRFESLRAQQKSFGKSVAQAEGEEKQRLLGEVKELSAAVKAADVQSDEAEAALQKLQSAFPNLIHDGVPAGGEDDSVTLRTEGARRDFSAEGFTPKDHLELAELLGAVDMERGAKVSGARFYFLRGIGARLELAMMQMGLDQALEAGFTPVIPPTLVRPETMSGTGFDVEHDDEIYRLERDDLYLVGTSEVALAGYYAGEIVDLGTGPQRMAGWSTCYRREAGSHGKDTRGILRVHQFNKLEMFVYCSPEDAAAEHERLLAWEEQMLAKMELPYRVVDIAAGDLGLSAARKFDCEAWIPSQQTYRELTSASDCTTFQARRLNIRERTAASDGSKGSTRPVATLNGTLATTRWLVAILENHQLPDGSVRVPEALRPYLGGQEVIAPLS
ncbi:MAG TPA: serine--tRNA ligase [Candidatus Nesterenkonia stercoripullorum]|uniref:Serine--tRNA ligase n=1 Tax=Candidatus Nesterenkonia stercoripullorum TaxID=2838701 RepID=A0A9D1UUV1_9MICC|nr:serine--tRNA ligase [Candidatus Nesterenkonia stercoripullorum]